MRRICACAAFWPCVPALRPRRSRRQKIIFDTDFVFPPQDDSMALFLVLNSPELEILGITTVAGNGSMNVPRPTCSGCSKSPTAPTFRYTSGANIPLIHEETEWDTKRHGGWSANDPAPAPPGGFAKKQAETERAIDFIVSTVKQNPGR